MNRVYQKGNQYDFKNIKPGQIYRDIKSGYYYIVIDNYGTGFKPLVSLHDGNWWSTIDTFGNNQEDSTLFEQVFTPVTIIPHD